MRVQVIQVPFDSGNRGVRMGGGPEYLTGNGLAEVLRAEGHEVWAESVEPRSEFRAEVRTQFELYGLLAVRVRAARREGKFPLILSGNCGATLGAMAGSETRRLGVVWFDAHGDFNTPETTRGGFLDGMGLAVAAGLCWKRLAASIPNFSTADGAHILHVGGRDFDPGEREMLQRAGAAVVDADALARSGAREALRAELSKLRLGVEAAHLHVDLDVFNPKEAPANEYATEEGGLSVREVSEAIGFVKENLRITSATFAALDPKYDPQGKTLRAALRLIKRVLSE